MNNLQLKEDDSSFPNFFMNLAISYIGKFANGLYAMNFLNTIKEKYNGLIKQAQVKILEKKSPDIGEAFLSFYNIFFANFENIKIMNELLDSLNDEEFERVVSNSRIKTKISKDLIKDVREGKLYKTKRNLDILSIVSILFYATLEQVYPRDYVSRVSLGAFLLPNIVFLLYKENYKNAKKFEQDNNQMRAFFSEMREIMLHYKSTGEFDIEVGNDKQTNEALLKIFGNKKNCFSSFFDKIYISDIFQSIMSNTPIISVSASALIAVSNINSLIAYKATVDGAEENYCKAEQVASAASLQTAILDYSLLGVTFLFNWAKDTKKLFVGSKKESKIEAGREVFVNRLKFINDLLGTCSSILTAVTLYNTAVEPEEQTLTKALVGTSVLTLSCVVESMNRKIGLFGKIYDRLFLVSKNDKSLGEPLLTRNSSSSFVNKLDSSSSILNGQSR